MTPTFMDAMVDHGLAEGTYAEIFTAAIQSAAYLESDIDRLLEIGLKKIPADCAVSKTVRLVIDCYNKGIDYKETRNRVVDFNRELGWFQAPANLGFVVIGLLYGKGDFKKSMIYAVNCGDDTDCTAATVGATLGIIGGIKAVPEEWRSFIGDSIITLCINGMYHYQIPKTCKELTNRVANTVIDVMKANEVDFEFTDSETLVSIDEFAQYDKLTAEDFLNFSPYSYDVNVSRVVKIKVELDNTPRVKSGDVRKVRLTFKSTNTQEPKKLQIKLMLPEGWQCGDYSRTAPLDYPQPCHQIFGISSTEFSVTVGENVAPVNRVYAEITAVNLPYPIMVPIIFIG